MILNLGARRHPLLRLCSSIRWRKSSLTTEHRYLLFHSALLFAQAPHSYGNAFIHSDFRIGALFSALPKKYPNEQPFRGTQLKCRPNDFPVIQSTRWVESELQQWISRADETSRSSKGPPRKWWSLQAKFKWFQECCVTSSFRRHIVVLSFFCETQNPHRCFGPRRQHYGVLRQW